MSDFITPGNYRLLSALLVTNGGAIHEISGFIPTFSIEESLESDCIYGYAEMYDSVGYLENLPIRGEENLRIIVEDAAQTRLTYELKVYKVSDINITDANDMITYKLHYVSRARYEASFRRIIQPFDDTVSNIARNVFESYYPSGFGDLLVPEETEGIFRCVIPNYTPIQTMNFLANRAYSTTSPSCSFRFFQTYDNFYFCTDEYLIKRAFDNPEEIKEFAYSDALNRDGEEFISEMQNMTEIRNIERINTMGDLSSGAYRSHVIQIDIIRGTVSLPGFDSTYSYNYLNERGNYTFTSGRGSTQDRHSDTFIQEYFTPENERRFIVVKDYEDRINGLQIRGNQFLPEIVTNRAAYRYHMNSMLVTARSNGRLDVNAGDLIKITLPEFNYSSTRGLNPQLSGYYLIKSLTHSFVRDAHQTLYTLMKYDWSIQQ